MGKVLRIVRYLTEKYDPEAIIVYGSFADGSADGESDFDALLIAKGGKRHDGSTVDGTVLDVFAYPPETFDGDFPPDEFLPVAFGRILKDDNGRAALLREKVLPFAAEVPFKKREDLEHAVAWCEKTLARAVRGGAEAAYRRCRLLAESAEIYCGVVGRPFYGSKKLLRLMRREDPESYRLYAAALTGESDGALKEWVGRIRTLFAPKR